MGTRDLFGRLLYLAATHNLDLQVVFRYPLTLVPLSLAHVDGTMTKTDKSALMTKLEKRICTEGPTTVDVCVFDVMFVIRSQVVLPATYGGIATSILERILSTSTEVHFVCDTYSEQPSIKDLEHVARESTVTDIEYLISGPEQKRSKDFQSQLKSPRFKRALLHFPAEEWKKQDHAKRIAGHKLYLGLEDKAWLYTARGDKVIRQDITELSCSHEEADTRMVWHVKYISDMQGKGNVVIRCDDTDVLVIFLAHVLKFAVHVWLDVGHNNKNNRRYIDVSDLAQHVGPQLCAALPGFHAFTGSDYTASFCRKGKVRPLAIMEKKFVPAFSSLGEQENVDPNVVADLEAFVCCLYGKPNLKSTNTARYLLFHDRFSPKNVAKPLEKIKGADSSSSPPCQAVLLQKIKRSNFVASVYKGAIRAIPTLQKPEDNGWNLQNGSYILHWFDGKQVPDNVCSHIDDDAITIQEGENEDEHVYCSSSDESDSDTD